MANVPNSADDALNNLKKISQRFASFVSRKGTASEADTRVKMIDKVLTEVCGWPESELSREDHVESGYTDYQLRVRNAALVVVEAKSEGKSFTLPHGAATRSPSLSGALVTDENVKKAIGQVRQYCDDQGVRFAIATNGYAWIVFRAIRDDMPWRNGRARVFPSTEYIIEHFTEFWNLLSYQAISEGSLDVEFGRTAAPSRQLVRVLDGLFNSEQPLSRNRLHTELQPLVRYVFEDIAAQDDVDLLRSCYVYQRSLRIVAEDLKLVIRDAIPRDTAFAGTKPLMQTLDSAGEFGDKVQRAVRSPQDDLYLLLGGIGSGKTTFLKRYERLIEKEFLDQNAFMFHLDFLQAPLDVAMLESFVWETILEGLRTRYEHENVEERSILKEVFAGRLSNLEQTALAGLERGCAEYEKVVGQQILSWQQSISEYVPRLLRIGCQVRGKTAVLVIDNVDQLDPHYQAQIFLLAQTVTRKSECVTIIAMREESYYAPSIERTFSAYTTHKFHIASPPFGKMIGSRIDYAMNALAKTDSALSGSIPGIDSFSTDDISEFLRIVEKSVFQWSRLISRFIECICFGNMRHALQMFTTFLTSGATDVDKMLSIYRRDGGYNVAFHEFLKSVMLQDRAYYRESKSPILNLFNSTAEKNSSHFTTMRLLDFLLARRGESTREGQGYVELSRLVSYFGEVFDNVADVRTTLDRMLNKQLVEVNTRSTETIDRASHIRVTAAGWYYLRYLAISFAYLDLILQDTPLNDEALVEELRKSVLEVNNLSDREQEKSLRMKVRFGRTQRFLDYLASEERREFAFFNMSQLSPPLSMQFMPGIIEQFQKDRAYIESRLQMGRVEDAPDRPEDAVAKELNLSLEDDDTSDDTET